VVLWNTFGLSYLPRPEGKICAKKIYRGHTANSAKDLHASTSVKFYTLEGVYIDCKGDVSRSRGKSSQYKTKGVSKLR
jgi:hypothetical protein